MTLSYDGTRYHGWQIQPNSDSVQARLQEALSTLLRAPISITGAGRTDTGVHARMMVAHFDWEGEAIDGLQLTYKLNRLLPYDIAVSKLEAVREDKHARFSATSRMYRYNIHTVKDPFLRAYSCEIHYPLDFAKMNEATEGLGLGLPLCKRHALTLGGDLVLDTSYTNGCRFILELPK